MGICSDIPCCCDDCVSISETINQTFAATLPDCYKEGSLNAALGVVSDPPKPVFNGFLSNGTRILTAAERADNKTLEINDMQTERKRLFIDVPLMLSKISGIPSMLSTVAVVTIFILIAINKPLMCVIFLS